MPKLIKDGQIIDNEWQRIDSNVALEALPSTPVLVPMTFWHEHQTSLSNRVASIGLTLTSSDNLSELAGSISQFPVIEIYFPALTDGRGFSMARLLRERYGFAGELRAGGRFIRDQLCYLRRCGFSAFDFDDDTDLTASLNSLYDFTDGYQPSVDQPTPLFARRS